jgi:NADH:ubiquinone oxidoreductase subunit K
VSASELLFHGLAAAALACALATIALRKPGWIARALLAGQVATSALMALAGARLPAACSAACAIALAAWVWRNGTDNAAEADAADDSAPRRSEPENATNAAEIQTAPRSGVLRAVPMVIALAALLLRSLLMANWPRAALVPSQLAARAPGLPPVGIGHYLVVAMLLVCAGLLCGMTRRSALGACAAASWMATGSALAIAAASSMVIGRGQGPMLATFAVLFASMPALVAAVLIAEGRVIAPAGASSGRIADGFSAVAAAVTLALLAGLT